MFALIGGWGTLHKLLLQKKANTYNQHIWAKAAAVMTSEGIINIFETFMETLLLQPWNLTQTLWYLPTHFSVYLLSCQLVIYTLWKGMSGFISAVKALLKMSSKTTEKCEWITGQHFNLLGSIGLWDLWVPEGRKRMQRGRPLSKQRVSTTREAHTNRPGGVSLL